MIAQREVELRARLLKFVMAGAVALLLSGQSVAQDALIRGDNVNEILNLAQSWGTADLESDTNGDPLITGQMEGLLYAIYFYGCVKRKNCDSIQFYASWSDNVTDNDKINEWNATRRWPTAMRPDDDSVVIKMNVNLDGGGITSGNLDDWIAWWSVGLETFDEFVNEK